MNRISRAELRSLAAREDSPCISIYLPLERTLPGARQNPLRFRHLLDQAQAAAGELTRPAEVREWLKPARELEDDPLFWRAGHAEGLCVLVSRGFFRVYTLPFACAERVEAGSRFVIGPLAHVLSRDDRYYVLAISPKRLKLYRGRGRDMTPVDLPADVPTSMAQALPGVEIEKSLQMHTTSARSVAGGPAAIVHGHGDPKDDMKPMLRDYVHVVCKRLDPLLNGEHAPLVLAAVDPLASIFRECCHYKHLAPVGVSGSADELTEKDIHDRTLPLVEPLFHRDFDKAARRYAEAIPTPRAGHQIHAIVQAAHEGRVETIFAALGVSLRGECDASGGNCKVNNGQQHGGTDLIDLAVAKTLMTGGDAFVVPEARVPNHGPIAALFRW